MVFTIAERIKFRNKQRLEEVVKKRKKMEAEATAKASALKRTKRRVTHDSDIEDLTPVDNDNVVPETSDKNSSGLRNGFEEDRFVNEIRDLVEKNPEFDQIDISSDSESETKEKRVFDIDSVSGDETESEDEDSDHKNSGDGLMADTQSSEDLSLSSSSSSSSSDDEEFSLDDVDDLRKASSSVRKVSKVVRKPLGRYKRVTKSRKEALVEEKVPKMNSRVDEEKEEIERVREKQNKVVYVCSYCCKEKTTISDSRSSFIRPHDRRVEDEDMNQFASNNVSRYEDSASINSARTPEKLSKPQSKNSEKEKEEKTPEKSCIAEAENSRARKEVKTPEFLQSSPETVFQPSRPEAKKPTTSAMENSEKAKDVQAKSSLGLRFPAVAEGVNKSGFVNELIDEEVASIRFANKPRNESEPKNQSEVVQGYEDERKYDDDGVLIIRPPPLIQNFGQVESPPPVISESEIEANRLWEEMEFGLKSSEVNIQFPTVESPGKTDCQKGNHDFRLDLEIGLKCINCSYVVTEINHMDVAEWGDMDTSRRRKIDRYEEERSSLIGKFGFESPSKNSLHGCVDLEGTVWDKIPGIKSQLYPHQKEGFEFIWRNLAGTIVLNELKNFEKSDETGGCIMSHAPGTGKTRLTITFLQSYLECFPDCKPVIIAPASLLLTWAEEFKKWNTCVPFHNLNNLEFSGKENLMALRLYEQKSSRSSNETRMVKIYSWIKGKSILGISYNLYEMLAGLLVLDEAHTPRNQRSCIWQTLSKVGTQKRILLSGTPFQNNFLELNNVLGLARPNYVKKLSPELQKRVLEAIEVSQTIFEVEYKQALLSIHPSLVSSCAISEKERLVLNEAFLAHLD